MAKAGDRTAPNPATQRRRLAAILRHLGEAVIVTNRRGQVVFLNAPAQKLTARSRTAVLGKPLVEILSGLGPGAGEMLARPPDGLLHDLRVDGPPRKVWQIRMTSIATGPDAGGTVVVVRDLTAERQSQQQLERQGRLALVGQLAAGLAHDFNNVLTVIIGTATILKQEDRLSPAVREKLDLIVEHGQRAGLITRQMMDFGRQSVGAERKPVDLALFLDEVRQLLDLATPEHPVRFEPSAGGRFTVRADPIQLQQALANLILNARDAMPQGGEIHLGLSRLQLREDEPPPVELMHAGDWIALSVRDTGIGMTQSTLEHLFEPFFTTKERGKGTGLGLAQVYGLVRQQDGFIDVISRPGGGTTFTLYLPAAGEEGNWGNGLSAERSIRLRGHRDATILLVDDEPTVRAVVAWHLHSLGHRVMAAGSGQEALDLYREHASTISLAIIDLVMPGMGGGMLYQALRRARADLPLIVLSAYPAEPAARNSGLDLDDRVVWVQKPASAEQLAEAVDAALGAAP
jgi:two-component system cell cycle sensor histidine kinase/response regulator CckA